MKYYYAMYFDEDYVKEKTDNYDIIKLNKPKTHLTTPIKRSIIVNLIYSTEHNYVKQLNGKDYIRITNILKYAKRISKADLFLLCL